MTSARHLVAAGIVAMILGAGDLAAEEQGPEHGVVWVVSPVAGFDRNELTQRGPGGASRTETDTAPEYGLFAMAAHPNVVVSDFLFFSDVNGADVFGNLLYVNLYLDADAVVTPNLGLGSLYHRIESEGVQIDVSDPMVKIGPRIRIASWHLAVSPYLGYAWERVRTSFEDYDNDSYLYGITLDWRWRMVGLNLKYCYQDSQELEDDFQNVHARFDVGITEAVGVSARVDFMEHSMTKDTSFLVGPAFRF